MATASAAVWLMSICKPVHMSVHMYTEMPVHMSMHICVRMCRHMPIRRPVHVYLHMSLHCTRMIRNKKKQNIPFALAASPREFGIRNQIVMAIALAAGLRPNSYGHRTGDRCIPDILALNSHTLIDGKPRSETNFDRSASSRSAIWSAPSLTNL